MGEVSDEDWEFVRDNCSRHSMTPQQWKDRGFEEVETVYLFTTNAEVEKHNLQNLRKLRENGSKVLKIQAQHNNSRAARLDADRYQGLQKTLYVAEGAKVLLAKNLCPRVGLSNGTTGEVKHIIFEDGYISGKQPSYIWVDFGTKYRGGTFFPGCPERSGWFPIKPATVDCYVGKKGRDGGSLSESETLSRTMFPLRLAWAWTIWKAQGQTMKGKIVLTLTDKEKECGLSYVAFSRATTISNIGIIDGVSCERLTTKINNSDKMKKRQEEDARLRRLAAELHKRMGEYGLTDTPD